MSVSDIELITRAWNFAAQRHVEQKRKGKAILRAKACELL
jgi:hypothetical protein